MSLNQDKLLMNDIDMSTILFIIVMVKFLLGEVTAYVLYCSL